MNTQLIAKIEINKEDIRKIVYEVLSEIENRNIMDIESQLGMEDFYEKTIASMQEQIDFLKEENLKLKRKYENWNMDNFKF